MLLYGSKLGNDKQLPIVCSIFQLFLRRNSVICDEYNFKALLSLWDIIDDEKRSSSEWKSVFLFVVEVNKDGCRKNIQFCFISFYFREYTRNQIKICSLQRKTGRKTCWVKAEEDDVRGNAMIIISTLSSLQLHTHTTKKSFALLCACWKLIFWAFKIDI